MAHDAENNLPMIALHVVTRLQDSIVVFGGIPVKCTDSILGYNPFYQDKRTIWTYSLHTDLWRKYVIPEEGETLTLSSGSTAVTIKTDIYMFATPTDDLATVWQHSMA